MMHILIAAGKLIPFLPALVGMPIKAYQYFMQPAPGDILTTVPSNTYQIVDYVNEITFSGQEAPIFNGGIVRNPSKKGGFLLSFRMTLDDYTPNKRSKGGLISLNRNLQVKAVNTLSLTGSKDLYINQPEDPRVFWFKQRLHYLYNALIGGSERLVLARLHEVGSVYAVADIHPLILSSKAHLAQKNWSPFVYKDKLYFIYSTNPALILQYSEKAQNVELFSESTLDVLVQKLWPFGEIRGGTPALYIPEWGAYLTFFHSSQHYKHGQPAWEVSKEPWWRIYYMGAYLFEAKPPFRILAITEKPLTYPGQYQDPTANFHIVYPCGFIEDGKNFIISAGIADKRLVLLKINKQQLYEHLTWLRENA